MDKFLVQNVFCGRSRDICFPDYWLDDTSFAIWHFGSSDRQIDSLGKNENMKDKRIKQIAIDITLAWGLITLGFFFLDELYFHMIYFSHSRLEDLSFMSKLGWLIIKYSVLPTVLTACATYETCMQLLCSSKLNSYRMLVLPLILILQVLFYWYLGILIGRFIVWIKNHIARNQRLN